VNFRGKKKKKRFLYYPKKVKINHKKEEEGGFGARNMTILFGSSSVTFQIKRLN
jgi:hypothetical protein